MNSASKMAGFSLAELLIAMLLGSLIVLASIQLLTTNQRTFATQMAVTRIQEDGQLSLRFLTNDLRMAGYSGTAKPDTSGIQFGPGLSQEGADNDTLAVTHVGLSDCQGSVSASPVSITNVYSVNAGNELVCDGSLTAGAATAILPDVEGFRVLYGIDTAGDGAAGPFRFVGATAAAALARPVVAVRFAVLLTTESSSLPEGDAKTWYVFDREVDADADNVLRRVFSTTVMLRNVDWEQI